jgi:hypothetical protein
MCARILKSSVRVGCLRDIFSSTDRRDVYIARLTVLFEDLRIELYATAEPSITVLDQTPGYRHSYFLRKLIATIVEFAEALRLLDDVSSFEQIKRNFPSSELSKWERSIRFFRKSEAFFKKVRNDIGGHFGSEAATYAVENFNLSVIGKIEVAFERDSRADVRLRCAGEIAAVALGRHLVGNDSEAKLRYLFRRVQVAYRYATISVQSLTYFHLWEKFR